MLGENAEPSTILDVEEQEQAASGGIDQCEIAMVVFSSSNQKNDASAKTIDDECDEDCESFHPSDLMSFAWQIARGMVTCFMTKQIRYAASIFSYGLAMFPLADSLAIVAKFAQQWDDIFKCFVHCVWP